MAGAAYRRTVLRGAIGAATLLALAGGPARAAPALPTEAPPWLRLQSSHFIAYSNAPEERARELVASLERFRAVLGLLHPGFSPHAPRPTHLYLFRSGADYAPYKLRVDGQPTPFEGCFLPSPDANYVTMNVAGGHDPLRIVYHEYTHFFLRNNLAYLPIWLNEGIAEFYSTYQGDARTAKVGLPIRSHAVALARDGIMPLATLFAMNETSRDYNEGSRIGPFYATSWALVHYLMAGGEAHRLRIDALLEQLRQGRAVEEAFREAFAAGTPALEQALVAYLKADRYPYSQVTFKQALRLDETIESRPMARDETLAALGDLLVHLGPDHAGEAEEQLQAALAANPSSARAHAGLGYLRYRQDRFADSMAHFEKVDRLAPDDYFIQYSYAESILVLPASRLLALDPPSADTPPLIALAREHLAKAIALRPEFSEAYVTLGQSYLIALGDVRDGIAALERARRLVPSRMDVVRDLVRLHLRNGDPAGARLLVENVLRRAGDATALAQALAALAESDPSSQDRPDDQVRRESLLRSLREVRETTPDPDLRRRVSETIEALERPPAPPRQIDAYNQAVALANKGDYRGAVALLERHLPAIADPDLAAEYRKFIARLRKDAARLGKPLR